VPRRPARQVAKNAVDIFRSIPQRNTPADAPGLQAIGVVVLEHDNLAVHPKADDFKELHRPTRIAPAPPNPKLGDPLHYQSMLQRICNTYSDRFGWLPLLHPQHNHLCGRDVRRPEDLGQPRSHGDLLPAARRVGDDAAADRAVDLLSP
jgi:hypothetical protein